MRQNAAHAGIGCIEGLAKATIDKIPNHLYTRRSACSILPFAGDTLTFLMDSSIQSMHA